MKYKINYIDGHDLRWKTFCTEAKDCDEAVNNLRKYYPCGDFDHQIAEIIVEGENTDEQT